jgi:hypothetical protein
MRSAATAASPAGRATDRRTRRGCGRRIDLSRQSEILPRLRQGDGVLQLRLVLATVEEVLGHAGGRLQGERGTPSPGPWRIRFRDGIERREGRAGEIERLALGKVSQIRARPRPEGRAGEVEGTSSARIMGVKASERRRLWP